MKERIKKTLYDMLRTSSADDIKVVEFCDEAGISKQTLYNNYYGLVGVMEELVMDMMEKAAAEYEGTGNWRGQTRAIMQMLVENRDVFLHIYNSKFREDLLATVDKRVAPIVRSCVDKYIAEADVELDAFDRRIINAFYMDIYMGVARRFMRNRMADAPDYVISRYGALLKNHGIRSVILFDELNKLERMNARGSEQVQEMLMTGMH